VESKFLNADFQAFLILKVKSQKSHWSITQRSAKREKHYHQQSWSNGSRSIRSELFI